MWFQNTSSSAYIDKAMNPSINKSKPMFCHRGYNSYNNTLVFRNETLNINDVLSAIEEILNKFRSYVLDKD